MCLWVKWQGMIFHRLYSTPTELIIRQSCGCLPEVVAILPDPNHQVNVSIEFEATPNMVSNVFLSYKEKLLQQLPATSLDIAQLEMLIDALADDILIFETQGSEQKFIHSNFVTRVAKTKQEGQLLIGYSKGFYIITPICFASWTRTKFKNIFGKDQSASTFNNKHHIRPA